MEQMVINILNAIVFSRLLLISCHRLMAYFKMIHLTALDDNPIYKRKILKAEIQIRGLTRTIK